MGHHRRRSIPVDRGFRVVRKEAERLAGNAKDQESLNMLDTPGPLPYDHPRMYGQLLRIISNQEANKALPASEKDYFVELESGHDFNTAVVERQYEIIKIHLLPRISNQSFWQNLYFNKTEIM